MKRRDLLFRLGATVVTVSGLTRLAAAEHGGHGVGPADHCARACGDCLIECAKHVHHCAGLLADGQRAYAKCLELCHACASSCSACIQSCFGAYGSQAAEACAAACEACAAECEKFSNDEAMKRCARTCRAGARACREFARARG